MASYSSKSYKKDKTIEGEKAKSRRPEKLLEELVEWADSPNVAEDLDEQRLRKIGDRVVREYDLDEGSRKDWLEKAKRNLARAKLTRQAKNYPFENASNVKYPLLTTAALQFAARAYPAIIDGSRVVKGQVIGDDADGSKRSKADRISKHMSYQLINEMPEWEEDTDTLLHQLPIVGCAFRKVWYDPTLKRNCAEMVSAVDFCVNQKTRSLDTTPRATQMFRLYPHEIEERMESGAFLDCDFGVANDADGDDDAPHLFLEQHRYLDLNDDGCREPWIVTVHKETSKVVRIVANYDPAELKIEDDKLGRIQRYNTFVKYPFFRDPEGGFYDLGFGELLESLSEVVDTTINQLLDAGHLQTAGGGFIGSGLRLKKNQMRFAPGQYHVVDAPGAKVREAIYNMEHPGPSPVLFQLLGMMVEAGKEIANVKDILTGTQDRAQPATTTLAMIEQGMKTYTSIFKRVYRALKRELQLLYDLNGKFLPEEAYFTVLDSQKAVARSDYAKGTMDVMPVCDPSIVTDMQKMTRAQAYMEAAGNPALEGILNKREALERYFNGIGAEDIEKLILPEPEGPNPIEQKQMEGMDAEVAGKQATAAKTGAEAKKAEAEAAIVTDDVTEELKRRDVAKFQDELDSMAETNLGIPRPRPVLTVVPAE